MLDLSAAEAVVDAGDAAEYAGLLYVSDDRPGISRKRAGKGFRYETSDAKKVTDPSTLKRIKALAVPPAWTEVWICSKANGHVQATGRDARGRKQYRYHPRFREVRESTKYQMPQPSTGQSNRTTGVASACNGSIRTPSMQQSSSPRFVRPQLPLCDMSEPAFNITAVAARREFAMLLIATSFVSMPTLSLCQRVGARIVRRATWFAAISMVTEASSIESIAA
jgi:hypothetical protein